MMTCLTRENRSQADEEVCPATLSGSATWKGGREGGPGKDFIMTHVTGGEEAASSPPAGAAAVPALGGGLALGNSPPPCKSIAASRNADPLERLLCLRSVKVKA